MITDEEKLIIEEEDTKLGLKRIFEQLTSSMIEYYEKNYLTKDQLKFDIQEAWILTMMRARKIDEKNIKKECVNERNKILKNNQNPNPNCSDPAQEEKIKALEKEIKDLNETLSLYEEKILKAKSENYKLKSENFDLKETIDKLKNEYYYTEEDRNKTNENGELINIFYSEAQVARIIRKHDETLELMKKNATPGTTSHNARGAGRKPKITEEQIAMIQMYRAQGKTLSDISRSMGISYGNVQKYSKL